MQRKVYSGKERRLLIGFHLGATCARACYSILKPGSDIQIEEVQRFKCSGGSAVPCVVYYDSAGGVRGIGKDECLSVEDVAGEEVFRLPIHWSSIHSANDSLDAPSYPLGKYPEQVLSDFLIHLCDEVQACIGDIHGLAILDPATIHYTLIGPSPRSETEIRSVAKKNGMIKFEQDIACMTFLTAEEAYFEACLDEKCNVFNGEEGGACIVNVDHDLLTFSSFFYKGVPGQVEAITEAQFSPTGYSALNEEAQTKLTELFVWSESEHLIPTMLEFFDRTIQPGFCEGDLARFICINPEQVQKYKRFTKVKSLQDKKFTKVISEEDKKFWLDGNTVASFFQPLVRSIVEGVLNQVRVARKPIYHIILVGVGASSDYIFQDVRKRLWTELPNKKVLRSSDQPGPGLALTGGVTRTLRCLEEMIVNASEEQTREELASGEPVAFTSTDEPDDSRPEFVDEAKQALKILENIVNTHRSGENQISALREENEKLKMQAEIRQKEYQELQEKNIRLSLQLKELEEWRERVMVSVGVIQEKTYDIIKAECPGPTVAEETGSSNE